MLDYVGLGALSVPERREILDDWSCPAFTDGWYIPFRPRAGLPGNSLLSLPYDQRTEPQLDRQLHLGHRGRCPPRCLRPRQVSRRDPPDDGAAPPRRGARTHQAGRAGHQSGAGRRRGRQPGRRAPASGRTGLLQQLEVHAPRPAGQGQPPAAPGRLRGLPRRLLAERPRHPRQLRVPQPDPVPLEGRRPGLDDREAHLARHKPEPGGGGRHRRHGSASRARQPRDGGRSSRS